MFSFEQNNDQIPLKSVSLSNVMKKNHLVYFGVGFSVCFAILSLC